MRIVSLDVFDVATRQFFDGFLDLSVKLNSECNQSFTEKKTELLKTYAMPFSSRMALVEKLQ